MKFLKTWIKQGFWEKSSKPSRGALDFEQEVMDSLVRKNLATTEDCCTYTLTASEGEGGASMIDVTYSELVSLIEGNALVPASKYRLTDYATVHYIIDEDGIIVDTDPIVTGPTEVLILTATSINTLSPLADSELHPEDIIHYHYSDFPILGDLSFYSAGNLIPGFKGVILNRVDTHRDISATFDWRYCKTRRWELTPVTWDSGTSYVQFAYVQYTSGGQTYIYRSRAAANLNHTPSLTNNTYWVPVIRITNDAFLAIEQGTSFGIDFSAATHVYAVYPCEIIKNASGGDKLVYFDAADTITVVAPTA